MPQQIKKIFNKIIWWSGVIMVGLVLGLCLQFAIAATWTGPTSAPPNDNVSAPLNTGANQQIKGDFTSHIGSVALAGVLETFGFKMPTGAQPGYVLTAQDTNGQAAWAAGGGGGLKTFCGATAQTYNGNLGGYSGANQKCSIQYGAGARMCMAADFVNGAPTVNGWYSTFVTGWVDQYAVDCLGWTTNAITFSGFKMAGPHWEISHPGPWARGCESSAKILCCK